MTFTASAHGPSHMGRGEQRGDLAEAVSVQETGIPVQASESGRMWGVELTTGWESRHVHYGVDESGPSGAYVNELGFNIGEFSFNAWNGFGLGNDLVEWDFTAAYNIEAGPVFVTPGYNFRYVPSQNKGGHAHADEHGHGGEHSSEGAGHAHDTYGNELFLIVGTGAIPYVTPSTVFIWDLNNNPGGFLEFHLDGEVPVYKEIVSLQPYALLGLNFGYNTSEVYGLNNFQFGLQSTVAINKYISAFAGVNYSVALDALDAIDQDNVVWVNVGLSFAY